MEIWTENTHDIDQFFRFFNEIVAKEKNVPGYKFNPRCFTCDEGGTITMPSLKFMVKISAMIANGISRMM